MKQSKNNLPAEVRRFFSLSFTWVEMLKCILLGGLIGGLITGCGGGLMLYAGVDAEYGSRTDDLMWLVDVSYFVLLPGSLCIFHFDDASLSQSVLVQLVFYTAVTVLFRAWLRSRKQRKRFLRGHCIDCNYDLHAGDGMVCSECGSRQPKRPEWLDEKHERHIAAMKERSMRIRMAKSAEDREEQNPQVKED